MVDFTDELCCQQSSYFFANCFPLLHGGPLKVIFDGLYFGVDTQTVLGQSPGYTWHVRRFPCKDVLVLTEELNERFFLFAVERR